MTGRRSWKFSLPTGSQEIQYVIGPGTRRISLQDLTYEKEDERNVEPVVEIS